MKEELRDAQSRLTVSESCIIMCDPEEGLIKNRKNSILLDLNTDIHRLTMENVVAQLDVDALRANLVKTARHAAQLHISLDLASTQAMQHDISASGAQDAIQKLQSQLRRAKGSTSLKGRYLSLCFLLLTMLDKQLKWKMARILLDVPTAGLCRQPTCLPFR